MPNYYCYYYMYFFYKYKKVINHMGREKEKTMPGLRIGGL